VKSTVKLFGIIALAAVIGFSLLACDTGTGDTGVLPPPEVDLSGLNAAISDAETLLASTAVSADGSDVEPDVYWATPAAHNTFANAISTAIGVRDNTASTQAQVNSAAATLRDATSAFALELMPGTLSPPPEIVEMVRVGGGVFYLGREEGTAGLGDVTPISRVTMSGFYIGRFPVTQGQFYEVMGFNPSYFTAAQGRPPAAGETDALRPVEQVNWYEAIVFSNRLSILRDLSPAYELPDQWPSPTSWSTDPDTWGAVPEWDDPLLARWDAVRIVPGSTGYRLPTEAQWEFAAKGGTLGGAYTFSGSDDSNAVAWHWDNSGEQTREVGGLQANRLGIYDMSGNVFEWVWDWFGSYTAEEKEDPVGASSGYYRVNRGGGWFDSAYVARSVYRNYTYPDIHSVNIGFRVARP